MPPSRLLRLADVLLPPLLALTGLFLLFRPVILSGFTRIAGDLGDARLVAYLLEHGARWLQADPGHDALWSPTFYFPEPNVGAYSDIFLGAQPFYLPWRWLGCDPLAAFQACFVTLAVVNFLVFYLFQRLLWHWRPFVAAFGAFLFAFASPRLVHVSHLQLHIHCWTILSLTSLVQICRGGPQRSTGWVACFFLGMTAQLYGSFYLGWLAGLTMLLALPWFLAVRDYRQRLAITLWSNRWAFLGFGALSLLALRWMALHYLQAVRRADYQDAQMIQWGIPYLTSWWSRGLESWFNLTNVLVQLGVLTANPWPHGEHALGLGPVTYGVVLLGICRLREQRLPATLLAAGLTILVLTSSVAPGVSLWQYLYPYIPGAAAMRALVRIALVFLIPFALVAAWWIGHLAHHRPRLALLLLTLCVLEQARDLGAYQRQDHDEQLARLLPHLPPHCQAFLLLPEEALSLEETYILNLDAMWLSMHTGLPTINGYSGRWPPDWERLEDGMMLGVPDAATARRLLRDWFPAQQVEVVAVPGRSGTRGWLVLVR